MRTFVFTLICVLFVLEIVAQQPFYLDTKKLSFSEGNYSFKIIDVIDATGSESVGFVQTGAFNKPREAFFQSSLTEEFTKAFNETVWATDSFPITVQFNLVKISELTTASREYAEAELNVSFLSNGGAVELYQASHVNRIYGVDVTNKHAKNIAEAMEACMVKFETFISNPEYDRGTTPREEISVSTITRELRGEGLYSTFEDFRDNRTLPLTGLEAIEIKESAGNDQFLKIHDRQSAIMDAWGINHGGQSYVRVGKFLYPVNFSEEAAMVLIPSKHLQSMSPEAAFLVGFGFGLVGVAAAMAVSEISQEINNATEVMYLDEINGSIITRDDWLIRSGHTTLLFSGSPFLKKDQKLKIIVDGVEMCSLGKDEYFEQEFHYKIQASDVCLTDELGNSACLEQLSTKSSLNAFEFYSSKKRGVEIYDMDDEELRQTRALVSKGKITSPCR